MIQVPSLIDRLRASIRPSQQVTNAPTRQPMLYDPTIKPFIVSSDRILNKSAKQSMVKIPPIPRQIRDQQLMSDKTFAYQIHLGRSRKASYRTRSMPSEHGRAPCQSDRSGCRYVFPQENNLSFRRGPSLLFIQRLCFKNVT